MCQRASRKDMHEHMLMCMCTYVYIYVQVWVCRYMCECMCIHMIMYIQTHTCVCLGVSLCTHMTMHVHMCTHICGVCPHVCIISLPQEERMSGNAVSPGPRQWQVGLSCTVPSAHDLRLWLPTRSLSLLFGPQSQALLLPRHQRSRRS